MRLRLRIAILVYIVAVIAAIVLLNVFSKAESMSRPTPYEISAPFLKQWHELQAQIDARPHVARLAFHSAQRQIMAEARRFNVASCGRRFGKTKLDSDLLVETAAAGFPSGYFAPTYKFLIEGWRDIKTAAEPLTVRANDSEHRIELSTGGVIEAWSLDNESGAAGKYKAGRSRKYKRVVIDEAALIPNLEAAFNYAIAPTLIDLRGDAWFTSTPSGKGGFYRFWLKGQDPGEPDWMSWRFPTTANPHIPPSELERARKEYPEDVFRQEYLAEFLEDGGAVFRNVRACIKQGLVRDFAEPYHIYVIGCDWAKIQDFSVFVVIDASTKAIVKIDRFNQIEYTLQIARLIALCEAFQPAEVVSEEQGNLALADALSMMPYRVRARAGKPEHEEGLPMSGFQVTNATKEEAIQALVLAFERREISIPDETVLLGELESFGMERLPSGRIRYSGQGGAHDDIVMALAEGWSRARKYMSGLELDERAKALARLDASLLPENLPMNPHPMAEVSAAMWMQEFAQEAQDAKKSKGGFMKELGLK